MATTQINFKIDENEADKLRKVQTKKLGMDKPKRAALGELGNRVIMRSNKDGQKDLKEQKGLINLRNTKPRVDTHWKKTSQPLVQADGAAVVKKRNSLTAKTGTTRQIVEAAAANFVQKTETKSTTIIAPTVKIGTANAQTKYTNKIKAPTIDVEDDSATTLRREDSNLSQRSLRSLKAAINRGTKQSAAKILPKSILIRKTVATGAASSVPSIKSEPLDGGKYNIEIVSVQSHSMKLLALVENIDEDDGENPILVSEYVNDIYAYLFNLEVELSIKENHLKDQKEVHPKMRAVLVDWINEVHFQFHLAPETFQMTVAIIDRYLQAVTNTSRQFLQLVGITALFIAAKYEELYPPPICDFVYITDDTYTKKQILQMEMKIVKALNFNLSRPLPIHFLRRFSKAARAEDYHHSFAKYFLELISVEYDFASVKPSEMAAAALNLALKLYDGSTKDSIWTPTLEYYTRYSVDHLKPLVQKFAQVVRNAPNAKLKAVYEKYGSTKLNAIALSPELSGEIIDSIINESSATTNRRKQN